MFIAFKTAVWIQQFLRTPSKMSFWHGGCSRARQSTRCHNNLYLEDKIRPIVQNLPRYVSLCPCAESVRYASWVSVVFKLFSNLWLPTICGFLICQLSLLCNWALSFKLITLWFGWQNFGGCLRGGFMGNLLNVFFMEDCCNFSGKFSKLLKLCFYVFLRLTLFSMFN